MQIKQLRICSIRGFEDTGNLVMSPNINLFVGQNNSGKSTLLKSLYQLQSPLVGPQDIRIDRNIGYILINLIEADKYYATHQRTSPPQAASDLITNNNVIFEFVRDSGLPSPKMYFNGSRQWGEVQYIPRDEPNNLFYPVLSKRKPTGFNESVDLTTTNKTLESFENLAAKVDRLSNPESPQNEEYVKLCSEIIGTRIGTINSNNGKKIGKVIDTYRNIPIEKMGDGIVNILGLIVGLCSDQPKIFIIEEMENDLHPKAIKKLIDAIIKKSASSQFFISTHSNIVAKYLGSFEKTNIFSVQLNWSERIPRSEVTKVESDVPQRLKLMEDLGYCIYDFEIHSGWLFLEESSAEVLIREHFIRWYAPKMQNKIRTISTNGVSSAEPRFEDFNRMFLFAHLGPIYLNKAWVILDGDAAGVAVIKKMKETYTAGAWHEGNFANFSKCNFEEYYPSRFADKVEEIKAQTDKNIIRKKKKELLENVKTWVSGHENDARNEFLISAGEVIEKLKQIEENI